MYKGDGSMRIQLHFLMVIISCCFLGLTTGCGSERRDGYDTGVDAQENQVDTSETEDNTPGSTTEEEVVPAPTPGPVPVPVPDGGGSQGAERPARTGNDDNLVERPREENCVDGIDNDEDGLTDCEDPDCRNQPCDDDNACTVDEVCTQVRGTATFTCQGAPRDCNDGNECSIDVCEETDDEVGFQCVYTLNDNLEEYGSCPDVTDSCTPEGNCAVELNEDGSCPDDNVVDACITGRCETVITEGGEGPDVVSFECVEAHLDVLPQDECGCRGDLTGDDTCFFNMCKEGACMDIRKMEGASCNDGNECTVMDACSFAANGDATCEGMAAPTECILDENPEAPSLANGCNKGQACIATCSITGEFCDPDDEDPCPISNGCPMEAPFLCPVTGESCSSEPCPSLSTNECTPGCACSDDEGCTVGDTCGVEGEDEEAVCQTVDKRDTCLTNDDCGDDMPCVGAPDFGEPGDCEIGGASVGGDCQINSDCSGYCSVGVCVYAGEINVDTSCSADSDCSAPTCVMGVCQINEEDVTGSTCTVDADCIPACDTGLDAGQCGCDAGSACASDVCESGECVTGPVFEEGTDCDENSEDCLSEGLCDDAGNCVGEEPDDMLCPDIDPACGECICAIDGTCECDLFEIAIEEDLCVLDLLTVLTSTQIEGIVEGLNGISGLLDGILSTITGIESLSCAVGARLCVDGDVSDACTEIAPSLIDTETCVETFADAGCDITLSVLGGMPSAVAIDEDIAAQICANLDI